VAEGAVTRGDLAVVVLGARGRRKTSRILLVSLAGGPAGKYCADTRRYLTVSTPEFPLRVSQNATCLRFYSWTGVAFLASWRETNESRHGKGEPKEIVEPVYHAVLA
jgi:hypothetical protein